MNKSGAFVAASDVFALGLPMPAFIAAEKTHDLTVDIVSFDDKAKTIRIRDDEGVLRTAPLLGKAVAESRTFFVGDRVVITCHDDGRGGHRGITALRVT
jgi:hypothetical protein